MREQGNGLCFLTEKNKVSVKIIDKDERVAGRRRVSNGGGYGAINGGARQLNSMIVAGGHLKGTKIMEGRHLTHSLLFDNSAAGEVVFGEGGLLGKKRTAEEESALPHWGHGKRSRGSRYEPSKHAVSVVRVASKSTARSEKAAPLSAPKPRGPSKLTSNITSLSPRNSLTSKTTYGFVHTNDSDSPTLRQNGGEAKDRTSHKERALNASQQKSAVADHGICRQLQEGDCAELATTIQESNGHINKLINNVDESLSHTNTAACISLADPSSLTCGLKSRVDFQSLEWPRIIITLTRKEKEDDFLVLKGSKLPQRPKKRPKAVERALHYCTPGNWLIDLSRGRYDVREKKSGRKKPRGLKAMESIESDT